MPIFLFISLLAMIYIKQSYKCLYVFLILNYLKNLMSLLILCTLNTHQVYGELEIVMVLLTVE